MSKLLNISPSPHAHSKETTRKLMYGVVLALMPALFTSVFYFGIGAIIVTATSVISCILVEFLIQKYILKKPLSISDGSALVTGLLLAFNLPSNIPIYIIIIGSIVAIGMAKMTFGGLGNNPFNPALVGRVFMLISFPVQMTSWPVPSGLKTGYIDALTGPTPLALIKEGIKNGESVSNMMEKSPTFLNMFLGDMGGSMGEVAAVALIIGLVYLLYKKIITWHIPVSIIGTITVFSTILWLINPESNANPVFHILAGGVLLGAIFMATDYVTSPMSRKAMLIYGCGIGLLTIIIRVYGAYPEGVSFAILIMNAFVPLMNTYIKPKAFGEEVKMAKIESTFKNMAMALTFIAIGASTCLGFVHEFTKKPIELSILNKKLDAIKQVVPEFNNNPNDEMFRLPTGEGDSLDIYPAKKDDLIIGYAINTYTKDGFSGNISIMAGFKPDGTIINTSVLQQKETPGLGTKMTEPFFKDQFINKNPSEFMLKVKKDGGPVDAITAATISSRAFCDAIQRAYITLQKGDTK